MVGLGRHDHTLATGVGLRHAHGQIVRFGAGALKHDAVELVRHRGEDIVSVVEDVLVQVARMRVEQ